MNLPKKVQQFIASALVICAASPFVGCGKNGTDSLEESVCACLAKEGITDADVFVPFVEEKPIIREWGRNIFPLGPMAKYYDMGKNTITTVVDDHHLGTTSYDQASAPERKRMDTIKRCLDNVGTPQSGPK